MATYSSNDDVKIRLRSEIPRDETLFDTDLAENRQQAFSEVVEALKLMDVSVGVVGVPSIIQNAEADIAAAIFIENHTEKYTTPKHERKSTALRQRGEGNIQDYLDATQEKKHWVSVNDVDSRVS